MSSAKHYEFFVAFSYKMNHQFIELFNTNIANIPEKSLNYFFKLLGKISDIVVFKICMFYCRKQNFLLKFNQVNLEHNLYAYY